MDALFGGPAAANDNSSKPRKRNLDREKAAALARAQVRNCELCGTSFRKISKDKDPLRFCSKSCSSAVNARKMNAKHTPKPASFTVYRPLCSQCGVRFTTKNLSAKCCSNSCRRKNDAIKSRIYSAANDNVDRSARPCLECGLIFSTSYGDKRSVYCSQACSSRNARRRKRKKERARLRRVHVETVDPIKVFERDGWRCQICKAPTPRNLRGTYNDRAPELDHVMPLSLGGAHSYMNTQCACRKCNAAKSDTPPDQPSLFAKVA